MTNYEINGYAVRVGQVWRQRNGDLWGPVTAVGPTRIETSGYSRHLDGGYTPIREHGLDLIEPVNAEPEPDKPEDIAHLYELVSEDGTERQLLHAYRVRKDVFSFFYRLRDRKTDPWWYSHATTESSAPFRLREQWQPCAIDVSCAADSEPARLEGYEYNTVTNEVRRVEG